jgi:hypothetical protein
MNILLANGTAAQAATKTVADFGDAIGMARAALYNGPLDRATIRLEKASRMALEVGNRHARELANFASEVRSAFETVQLVEMCFLDLLPEQ